MEFYGITQRKSRYHFLWIILVLNSYWITMSLLIGTNITYKSEKKKLIQKKGNKSMVAWCIKFAVHDVSGAMLAKTSIPFFCINFFSDLCV